MDAPPKVFPYTLVLVSLTEEGVVGSEFVSIISSSGRARSALFSNRGLPALSFSKTVLFRRSI